MAKMEHTFEIEEDQFHWLEQMAQEYDLPDVSKALRILLDHAVEECDAEDLFNTIRCRHC